MHPALRPPLPGLIPPWIWLNGQQYYSMPELARRRHCSRWAADKWARNHPHLCCEHNGHRYCRLP